MSSPEISTEQKLQEIATAEAVVEHAPSAEPDEFHTLNVHLPHDVLATGNIYRTETGQREADLEWVYVSEQLRGENLSERVVSRFAEVSKELGAQSLKCVIINPAVIRVLENVFGEENLQYIDPEHTEDGPLPLTSEQAFDSMEIMESIAQLMQGGLIPGSEDFTPALHVQVDL
jgi:hypothetical protein